MIVLIIMAIIVLISIVIAFHDDDAFDVVGGVILAILVGFASIILVSTWYHPNYTKEQVPLKVVESTGSYVTLIDGDYVFKVDDEVKSIDTDYVDVHPIEQDHKPYAEVRTWPTQINKIGFEIGYTTSYDLYIPSDSVIVAN